MPKSRAQKRQVKEEFSKDIQDLSGVIVSEYSGVSTANLTELRQSLHEVNCQFKVVNNRIVKKALEEEAGSSFKKLEGDLSGPTALTYIHGDVAAGTKKLLDFAKAQEKFVVRSGIIEGNVVPYEDLKAIADLPPKEVLIAKILGSIVSPHRSLMNVLSGVSSNLVRTLSAIKDKKSK